MPPVLMLSFRKSERTTSRYFNTDCLRVAAARDLWQHRAEHTDCSGNSDQLGFLDSEELPDRRRATNSSSGSRPSTLPIMPNWESPDTNRSVQRFRPDQQCTRTMRELQFGLKYIF